MVRTTRRGSVSLSLAGWLWADILLGLFAIFLAASAVASAPATAKATGLDPKPLEFRVVVDGAALLSSDPAAITAEQQRIAAEVAARVAADRPGRHSAIVFAYGSSERASDGDRLATLATEPLTTGAFQGALLKAYHELVAGDPGSTVAFEIYFDE
jgi:hypothetical protein